MKKRLDILVFEKGFAKSREEAKRLILSGNVLSEGKVLDKAGMSFDDNLPVEIKETMPYVSRGALKIEKAYQEFKIDFKNKVVCDIGASTGGFTDFALQHGAKKVYAIDVGYGQLDQKLRNDPRVVNMERTNIRDIDILPEPIDIFVMDLSFISLKKVLPTVKKLVVSSSRVSGEKTMTYDLRPVIQIIALIKPQFEVGKKIADKYKGVIKDERIRQSVVEDIRAFSEEIGFGVKGITESPILGAKGNKEFLLYLISN